MIKSFSISVQSGTNVLTTLVRVCRPTSSVASLNRTRAFDGHIPQGSCAPQARGEQVIVSGWDSADDVAVVVFVALVSEVST